MSSFDIEYRNITSPAKKESEDAFVLNDRARIYGVLDGATPLIPFEDEHGHNGAYLAAQLFKEYMESRGREASLVESIRVANKQLYEQMIQYRIDTTKAEERWSTCVAVVKLHKSHVEYVHLGDTMIIAGYENGSCEVLTTDTVTGISERAKHKREKDRQSGIEVPEEKYFANVMNNLQYNRRMANIENGYTVANGMEAVNEYLDHGTFAIKGVKDCLIISDGVFHPKLSLQQTYERVHEIGLERYLQEVADDQKKYSLPVDDRTVVQLKFS